MTHKGLHVVKLQHIQMKPLLTGMGFVKFKLKESAEKCLQEAENSGIVLDGRHLVISLAVSREESTKFNEKKQKEKKDNRNLYLGREGSEYEPWVQGTKLLSNVVYSQ